MKTTTELASSVADAVNSSLGLSEGPTDDWLEKFASLFLAAYTEQQEPALKGVDTEWLTSVLRYAEKNPDYFPEIADGKYSVCGEDAEFISTLYDAPPLPAIPAPVVPDGMVLVPRELSDKASDLLGDTYGHPPRGWKITYTRILAMIAAGEKS